MSSKKVFVVVAIFLFAGGLSIGGYYLAPSFIGTPPTKEFVPKHSPEVNHNFPELDELRAKVKANAEDLIALESLSQTLKGKVIATQDRNLIFELIDTLVKILKVDPENKYALIELANVSFESRAFPKALEFYQRYLAIEPEDLEIRSRYASCFIFLDRHSEGLKELEIVLAKDPKNFSALAYKAIALSQTNQVEEAKKVGETALSCAPDEEGKKRFLVFLDSLSGKSTQNALLNYLESNEITSSKFQNIEKKEKVLVINFKDFPVQNMPEFAKQKFIGNLREQTARVEEYQDVETLEVRDVDTGEELLVIKQQD